MFRAHNLKIKCIILDLVAAKILPECRDYSDNQYEAQKPCEFNPNLFSFIKMSFQKKHISPFFSFFREVIMRKTFSFYYMK